MSYTVIYWIAGVVILLVLMERLPKLAGWLLLCIVLALLVTYNKKRGLNE